MLAGAVDALKEACRLSECSTRDFGLNEAWQIMIDAKKSVDLQNASAMH
jgi:hypothetical protein